MGRAHRAPSDGTLRGRLIRPLPTSLTQNPVRDKIIDTAGGLPSHAGCRLSVEPLTTSLTPDIINCCCPLPLFFFCCCSSAAPLFLRRPPLAPLLLLLLFFF
jgi:hypothetical protein